jgi:hypothetical protein
MSKEIIAQIVRTIIESNTGCRLDNKEEVNKLINDLTLALCGDVDFWAGFNKVEG